MKTMLICLSLTACASPAFAECAHWFSWPCGITPATSVPVFAYAKKKKVPPAHAQAQVVYPSPAPAPIDLLYASCSDMRIVFPACPGN
jgi:hypothetical protein